LSGGQKQRVGIARALANYPHLLLCDEATSALDPETTQAILRLLSDINQKLGLTIVLITHEMQVIRTICDQVAVIDAGEIVESGDVADVFLHPQHAVTQSLVAENQALDLDLLQRIQRHENSQLLRLTYVGAATHEPILSRIAAQTKADITILQGTISRIKNTPYGQLLVELSGTPDQIAVVLNLLRDLDVRTEIIEGAHWMDFSNIDWEDIAQATLDTLTMTGFSLFFTVLLGLPLGVLLLTGKNQLLEQRSIYALLSFVVNILRSVPFIILLIVLIPFTLLLVGTSLGVAGTIPPLVIGTTPFLRVW
jgi:hypothetical protein